MRSYNLSEEGRALAALRARTLPQNKKWLEGMAKRDKEPAARAHQTTKNRKAQSQAMKARWGDPIQRAKICAGIKRSQFKDKLPWPQIERDADEAFRAANINFEGR